MTQAAAKTSAGPMTLVAIEQFFPETQRLVEDNLAQRMLPLKMRAFAWMMRPAWARDWMVRATEKRSPGLWSGMMCRKRYIDEKLVESAREMEAVVNLGAGFDTRAYRLPALAEVAVWEVDQQEIIDQKRARLQKLFGAVPAHVRLVPIDLNREKLEVALAAHGYSSGRRTFFVLEALTQYLTEAGIKTTFGFLARAAPGSRLAFTYVRQDFLDGEILYGQEALYQRYVEREQVWLFGMDPDGVAGFVGQYGWHVVAHLGAEEADEQYVKPTGRELATIAIERMVVAEKSNDP